MQYLPIGKKILVKLVPETRMWHGLHMPDKHSYAYCTRCHQVRTALRDYPCIPTEDWSMDTYRDRPVFKGVDRSHKIEYAKAPTIEEDTRIGTVISCGARVREVTAGDRVLVPLTAGGSTDDIRLVREEEILGTVEDD